MRHLPEFPFLSVEEVKRKVIRVKYYSPMHVTLKFKDKKFKDDMEGVLPRVVHEMSACM